MPAATLPPARSDDGADSALAALCVEIGRDAPDLGGVLVARRGALAVARRLGPGHPVTLLAQAAYRHLAADLLAGAAGPYGIVAEEAGGNRGSLGGPAAAALRRYLAEQPDFAALLALREQVADGLLASAGV